MRVGMTSESPTLSMFVMLGVFLTRLACSTHLTEMAIVGTSIYHDWVKPRQVSNPDGLRVE